VGLPLWLANVEFALQVQSTGDEYESHASGADAVEYLKRMLALFASHGLFAVLVLDDSDIWLRIPNLDRTGVANAFFMRTVRMITKELDAGLVLAVHDDYLELAGYGEARQWLSGEIRIPRPGGWAGRNRIPASRPPRCGRRQRTDRRCSRGRWNRAPRQAL
jgi:hypothetical protein